jgi:hypothetical protein
MSSSRDYHQGYSNIGNEVPQFAFNTSKCLKTIAYFFKKNTEPMVWVWK